MKNKYSMQLVSRMLLPIFVAVFSLFVSKVTFGQAGQCVGGGCTLVGSSWGAAQSTTSATFVNSVAGTWGGEYNTYNVTSGNTYEWSLCPVDGATNPTGDGQLTLRNMSNTTLCYSDDLCGASPKILWVATFTGQVTVLVTQYYCTTNSNSHTVRWRQAASAPTGPVTCSNANAYGASGAVYTGDEEIFNVTFGTLSSTSTCATTAPGANSSNQLYSNYAGQLAAPVVNPGQSIPWSVNIGTCGGWYGVNLRIYFDFNIDGDFADANENPVNITAVNGVNSGTIAIPAGATVGQARMRVIATEGTVPGPTGTYLWGETEDYCIQVAAAVNCSGIPNASTASITSTGGCPNASITLSASNFTFGTGISYQWQSSANGVTGWTNIAGATATNYTTSTASTLYYRLVTSCLYSASSNQSNVVSYAVAGNQCACGAYPASVPFYNYYNDITNVTIAGINNSSTCTTVAPGPGSQLNLYSNYTGSVGSGNLQQGQVANFSLTSTGCVFGSGSNFFQVYIDYNQDGDFLDAGELCYYQPVNAGGDQTLTGNFVVPPTASVGVTRMRIVNVNYGTPGTYNYATYTYYYGETEDYCITISIPPPCAGTPTPGNTIANPTSIFAGQTTVLTLQNSTSGTGITYQWQSGSTATGPWTNITGATSYTYTATPTATTWYQCIVTCTNGPSSGTSTPVQVLYNPYCNPAYFYGTQYGDLISAVAIPTTTLNNVSGTATNGPAYTFYSNIAAPTLQAATSYQLQVTAGSFSNQSFAAWIDYNDNYIFEPSEKVGFSTAATTASFQTVSFQINLACTPPLGVHRMRVRGVYATAGSTIDPCATYYYGETEDYNVNIVAGAPFTPSFTASPTTSACTLTNYTYTTQAGMLSYVWGIPGTAGVDYTIITGGTSTSNTVTLQWLSGGSKTVSINYLNASGCTSTGAVSTTVTVQSTVAIVPITGIQSVCAGAQVTFATTTPGGTWSSSNTATATIVTSNGVVAGIAPGTATMTYTVPNPGSWCPASTATRTITVLPTPILTTSLDVDLCAGATTTLSGTIGFNTTCNQTITLYDSFGDGWNGCTATVLVGGVPVLTNITLPNGAGPLAFSFPSTNGQAIQVTFSPASWPYEPYFTITNGAGTNLVTNYYPYSSGTWNGTASGCPSITPVWSPATGLSATNVLNPVASPTTTQSYTMSATASNGCSATSTPILVTVLPVPANAPINGPSAVCAGSPVNFTNPVSGGTWSSSNTSVVNVNGSTGSGVGSTPGTATVSYTTNGANGCTTTTTATLAVAAIPVATITASGSTAICQGASVTLTASPAASYLWNNNATTQSITVSAAGTYTVEVINATGCASAISAPTTVTVNALPVAAIAANGTTVFCQGGSVDLTATGGSTYVWSNNTTGATLSATTNGVYTVTATNANGCQATSNAINVTVNPAPVAAITANGPTSFCQGNNVVLTASGNGAIVWTNAQTSQSITVSTAGSYAYTITGANGCSSTATPTVVAVGTLPIVPAITGANNVCSGASTLFANTMSGGTWTSSNAAIASVDALGSVSGSSVGSATISYEVSQSGCSATVTKVISVQAAPVASISALGSTSFCQGANVTLVSSPGATYAWSNGASTQNVTLNTAGPITVEVTGTNGCSATSAPQTITVNALPVLDPISGASVVCVGSTGTISNTTAGGTWSSANANVAVVNAVTGIVSGNTAGTANMTYSYTNVNGCSASVSAPVVIQALPSAATTVAGSTVFCQGGSVTISAPTAASYLWSPSGETTQSISATAAGTYTVQVSNGACSSTSPATVVTVNALPAATVASTATSICQGGSVTLTAAPATSYTWTNGATTQSITVTAAGNYGVTVSNINGCTSASAPTTISVSAAPASFISAAGPTTFCNGSSVVLSANTGSSYVWSNGATTQDITANASGIYFVTITNAAGCSTVSNEIIVNAQQSFGATATAVGPTAVCDGAFVTLVASPGASYLWSNGSTTQGINAGVNGNYNVTVTNALGCTSTSANIPVTILPVPTAGITTSGATTFCEGGSVVLTGTGGNTYIWNSNINGATITATQGGAYVVTAYAANGCSDAAEVIVNVNEVPSGSLILDGNAVLCPGETLVISAQPNNTYAWSNSATTQSITVTTPGTYSAVLTGLNGCTSNSDVVTVTAGAATSSTIDATALSSYVLNEVIYTQSGTYTQTLTNAAGCDSTITLNLTLTVGIEEGSITDVTLYPNPTSESFTIQTSTAVYGTFSIVDAQGKLVFAGEMTGTETNVNIASVARGIYYLRIPEVSEPLRVVKN
jgi:hypothetical protein